MNKAAKDRLIKLAREANSTDAWWEFADVLLEEVPDGRDEGESSSSHKKDGSQEELAEVAEALIDKTGNYYTVNRLRILRATARAWPPHERHRDVEFAVHERLRSPKAKAKVASYKRRAERDYKAGRVPSPRLTNHRVKCYRADDRGTVTWAELVAKMAQRLANRAQNLAELDAYQDAIAQAFAERRKELR